MNIIVTELKRLITARGPMSTYGGLFLLAVWAGAVTQSWPHVIILGVVFLMNWHLLATWVDRHD